MEETKVRDGKKVKVRNPAKSLAKKERTEKKKLRNVLKHNGLEVAEKYATEHGLRAYLRTLMAKKA